MFFITLADQKLVVALQGDENSLSQVLQQWSEGLVRTGMLMSVIGKGLEAITDGLEAIADGLEAIADGLEAIAGGLGDSSF